MIIGPKPRDIQATIKDENKQIFTFEKVETQNVWHFLLTPSLQLIILLLIDLSINQLIISSVVSLWVFLIVKV